MELPTKVIPPSGERHTHTIIFLHGRGSNAENFAREITISRDSQNRTLIDNFPTARWVFPSATVSATDRFPGDRISQWFDIWNVANFTEREELQAVGLRESVLAVRRIVQLEVDNLGGRWDRVVLAGLSQGGATAVHTLLNLSFPARRPHEMDVDMPQRLAAFVGFCCRMPFPERSLAETRRVLGLERVDDDNVLVMNTPVLLSHCADDPLVLVQNGRQLRDTLAGFGANVTWKEYPEGGHWIQSPNGIEDAVEFLKTHVFGGR